MSVPYEFRSGAKLFFVEVYEPSLASVSFGSPYVSLPVLSKIAVRHSAIYSSTTGLLTVIARRAQSEIEPMMTIGIPISSGQGVAMTSTARKQRASPLIAQARMATVSAIGV
jgi:hypothetical protein